MLDFVSIYTGEHSTPKDHIKWEGDRVSVQALVSKYLGHILAHPERVKKAHEPTLDEARTQLDATPPRMRGGG